MFFVMVMYSLLVERVISICIYYVGRPTVCPVVMSPLEELRLPEMLKPSALLLFDILFIEVRGRPSQTFDVL